MAKPFMKLHGMGVFHTQFKCINCEKEVELKRGFCSIECENNYLNEFEGFYRKVISDGDEYRLESA